MGKAIILDSMFGSTLGAVELNKFVELTSLSINGKTTVEGKTSIYSVTYNPSNTSEKGVIWSIVDGNDYGTINQNTGLLTINDGAEGTITIKATSTIKSLISNTLVVNVKYNSEIPDTPTGGEGGEGIDNPVMQAYLNNLDNAVFTPVAEFHDINNIMIANSYILGDNPFVEGGDYRVTIKGFSCAVYWFTYKDEQNAELNYKLGRTIGVDGEQTFYVHYDNTEEYQKFGFWKLNSTGIISKGEVIVEKIEGASVQRNIIVDFKLRNGLYALYEHAMNNKDQILPVILRYDDDENNVIIDNSKSYIFTYSGTSNNTPINQQIVLTPDKDKATGNISFNDVQKFMGIWLENQNANTTTYKVRLFLNVLE